MSEDEMVKDYVPPEQEHLDFGVLGVPEEPEDLRSAVERANEQADERAREEARAFHMNRRIMGDHTPAPDHDAWPERYRDAYEKELARLEQSAATG